MSDLHSPIVSFEVFPPKSESSETFLSGVASLAAVGDTVSVTYGAGGSGRERSHLLLDRLITDGLARRLTPHITAAGHTKESLSALALAWRDAGIERAVALRGDAAGEESASDLPCAAAVVETLRRMGPFDISVACYPEGHPKSASPDQEMDHLKRKFDAGATQAISQFFFDPDVFLRYRDRCIAAGITGRLVPGLLPIGSLTSVHRFAQTCGASVPPWLDARFEGLEDDPETARALSIATVVSLADRLTAEGVTHLHLYTLNRFKDALTIARALTVRNGVHPNPNQEAA